MNQNCSLAFSTLSISVYGNKAELEFLDMTHMIHPSEVLFKQQRCQAREVPGNENNIFEVERFIFGPEAPEYEEVTLMQFMMHIPSPLSLC